jgi:hypothetical protein
MAPPGAVPPGTTEHPRLPMPLPGQHLGMPPQAMHAMHGGGMPPPAPEGLPSHAMAGSTSEDDAEPGSGGAGEGGQGADAAARERQGGEAGVGAAPGTATGNGTDQSRRKLGWLWPRWRGTALG